ncbi:MAG: helix-turn-helix domain-containing protein [Clostridia bacterium]|nr:helix-turn-helix domain-containing protein [Clostridia bacterium]
MKLNYLTVDDVKVITRMSNDSIRKCIRNNLLKASIVGIRYLIEESDLEKFIKSKSKKVCE